MKPINAYRRATQAGLQIDLNEHKEGLLVFGPRSVKRKHLALLKTHCAELVASLVTADNHAAAVIDKAKRCKTAQPTCRPTRTTP